MMIFKLTPTRILLGCILCCTSICYGREDGKTQQDAALWFNIYLEKRLTKKWAIHLNQQNRINNNISTFGLWYADLGITYKFNKNIKIMADYVFAQKRKESYWSNRHQSYIALYFRKKYARWILTDRNMLQDEYTDIYSSENGKIPSVCYRNKLTIKREINKYFSAYVAQEFYLPLNDYKQKSFDRSRSFVGLFRALSRFDEIEFYFMFQNQLNPLKQRKQDFVYGIGYAKEF